MRKLGLMLVLSSAILTSTAQAVLTNERLLTDGAGVPISPGLISPTGGQLTRIYVQRLTGGMKLTNCPIVVGGYPTDAFPTGCLQADPGFQLWSLPSSGDTCLTTDYYEAAGRSTPVPATCAVRDQDANRGHSAATINDPPDVGCGRGTATWTIAIAPASSIYYVDSNGVAFRLTGTLAGSGYTHVNGQDRWSVSASPWLNGEALTEGGQRYSARFTLSGIASSTTQCDPYDAVVSIAIDLSGSAVVAPVT